MVLVLLPKVQLHRSLLGLNKKQLFKPNNIMKKKMNLSNKLYDKIFFKSISFMFNEV